MSIYFASLFGVDFDLDLLPFWMKHYEKLNLDDYFVCLHSQERNKQKIFEALNFFKKHEWNFEVMASHRFGNGLLRSKYMQSVCARLDLKDFLITADSDEFQRWDWIEGSSDPRDLSERFDCIYGTLRDCYTVGLPEANPCEPLSLQYPRHGNIDDILAARATSKVWPEASAYPWPRITRNKILGAYVSMNVDFLGSHLIHSKMKSNTPLQIPPEYSGYGPMTVDHYSFRASLFDRMRTKTYFDARHLWVIGRFFCIPEKRLSKIIEKDIQLFEKSQFSSSGILQSNTNL